MNFMNLAIQSETVNGEFGDFVYDYEAYQKNGALVNISPVFTSLVELFKWEKMNTGKLLDNCNNPLAL